MRLSPREEAIMKLVAAGRSDKEIAVDLRISIHTVRSYLNRIFRRYSFHNRTEAATAFERFRRN